MRRREFLQACAAAGLAGCAASTVRGSTWKAWGTQGTRDGAFIRPRAIGVHAQEVYVIDMTGRVQVFSLRGEFLRLWELPRHDNGTPTGITFSATAGRVIIPDTHNSRILEYTPEGELLAEWGSYGTGPNQFIYPTDVALAADGVVYISEYGQGAERVHVFDESRTFLRQWGSHGDAPAAFNRAMAIAMNAAGEVYVADTANHRVQVFSGEGGIVRVFGSTGVSPLKYPHDLALLSDGTLLIAEYGSHRISRWSQAGTFREAFGRPGRGPGELNAPRGVSVSESGQVFVADTDNHRVQSFQIPLGAPGAAA